LVPPTEDVDIKYLNTSNIDIKSIELLGYEDKINYNQSAGNLKIELPSSTDLENAWVFRIMKR